MEGALVVGVVPEDGVQCGLRKGLLLPRVERLAEPHAKAPRELALKVELVHPVHLATPELVDELRKVTDERVGGERVGRRRRRGPRAVGRVPPPRLVLGVVVDKVVPAGEDVPHVPLGGRLGALVARRQVEERVIQQRGPSCAHKVVRRPAACAAWSASTGGGGSTPA